jgi:hypothetical protein
MEASNEAGNISSSFSPTNAARQKPSEVMTKDQNQSMEPIQGYTNDVFESLPSTSKAAMKSPTLKYPNRAVNTTGDGQEQSIVRKQSNSQEQQTHSALATRIPRRPRVKRKKGVDLILDRLNSLFFLFFIPLLLLVCMGPFTFF